MNTNEMRVILWLGLTLKTSEKNPDPIFCLWKSSRRFNEDTACFKAWHEDPVLRRSQRVFGGSDSSLFGQNNFSPSFGSHGVSYKQEFFVIKDSMLLLFACIITKQTTNLKADYDDDDDDGWINNGKGL